LVLRIRKTWPKTHLQYTMFPIHLVRLQRICITLTLWCLCEALTQILRLATPLPQALVDMLYVVEYAHNPHQHRETVTVNPESWGTVNTLVLRTRLTTEGTIRLFSMSFFWGLISVLIWCYPEEVLGFNTHCIMYGFFTFWFGCALFLKPSPIRTESAARALIYSGAVSDTPDEIPEMPIEFYHNPDTGKTYPLTGALHRASGMVVTVPIPKGMVKCTSLPSNDVASAKDAHARRRGGPSLVQRCLDYVREKMLVVPEVTPENRLMVAQHINKFFETQANMRRDVKCEVRTAVSWLAFMKTPDDIFVNDALTDPLFALLRGRGEVPK